MSEDIYLYPEDLIVQSRYQTRLWAPSDSGIEELARSIIANGQLDTGVAIVDPQSEGKRFVLTIGHRRRQAIALINQWYDAESKALLKMRVRVDRMGDAFRKAIISNWHLSNFSPMDKAAIIVRLRKLYRWVQREGTDKIAAYIGVSPATIIQYEKFMKVEPALQAALHSGAITPESAFELVAATQVKAKAVLKLAAALEAESSKLIHRGRYDTGPIPGRIRRPSIRSAIAALTTQRDYVGPRATRDQLIRFFFDFDNEDSGYFNGDLSEFVRAFRLWAQGSVTIDVPRQAFKKLTELAYPGFPKKRRGPPKGFKPPRKFSIREMQPINRNQIEI